MFFPNAQRVWTDEAFYKADGAWDIADPLDSFYSLAEVHILFQRAL